MEIRMFTFNFTSDFPIIGASPRQKDEGGDQSRDKDERHGGKPEIAADPETRREPEKKQARQGCSCPTHCQRTPQTHLAFATGNRLQFGLQGPFNPKPFSGLSLSTSCDRKSPRKVSCHLEGGLGQRAAWQR